ncbi:DUF389 domain-containing protein [Nitrosococcus wardiae]|uniref:DUF389 domain-containing protein n=1 Tax=Nitrosococcus wardiae TaxID=1814290 RepID=A0A4V1AVM8_9GAMM|nr:DUF389 domain-containing protein [Nitrosococcus wardiae]QBQ53685.1 DUF389 domain-containing protein [Nitrosococcus wardiae]
MRQLYIEVSEEKASEVIRQAQEFAGMNLWHLPLRGWPEGKEKALILAHLPNRQVGSFLQAVQDIDAGAHFTLEPRGILSLRPPADKVPEQTADVSERSPFEIYLSGVQSIGSLRGFISYAVAGGIVVWIGLITNTVYLLVAAMLIAPFAGPAMNAAIGTATGNLHLLRRSIGRYVLGLVVTAGVTALLTLLFQLSIATSMMVEVSKISVVSALLPLAAGAAGAINLVQSERDSLVSGAAVGMLVAASLAPPTGLLGISLVLGEWAMAKGAAFVLLLQLVGINFSGAVVFRLYGLSGKGPRFLRGRKWAFPTALASSIIVLAGLLGWQFSSSPELQRSTRAQRAIAEIRTAVEASNLAQLVEANARFTRASIPEQNSLLAIVYVQRARTIPLSDAELRRRLTHQIQEHLLNAGFNVTPLVSVTVLKPPDIIQNGISSSKSSSLEGGGGGEVRDGGLEGPGAEPWLMSLL